jgi:hypothetical protein
MRNLIKLILCLSFIALVGLAFPVHANAEALPAQPQGNTYNDKIVFGDTFTLGSGDILDGNLTVFGGVITLENGSAVKGNVVLMGGTLNADGDISGNLNTLGGSLFLADQTVIHGNLSMLGGTLHRSAGAQILGQVINGGVGPFNLSLPRLPFELNLWSGFQPFFNLFRTLINVLVLAALAILVVLLWPHPTDRIAQAVGAQPVITGGLGLLTVVVLPALLIILLITIILIPVSILGFLALGIAALFGWIAVGLEVGKRIAPMFKQEWQPAISAGVGTLVISLISSFIGAIPCVGWIVPFLIGIIGLGGVIITRFGSQTYPLAIPPSGPSTITVEPHNPPSPQAPSAPTSPASHYESGTNLSSDASDSMNTKTVDPTSAEGDTISPSQI